MKLTTIIFGVFIAVAMAAPAANPEANNEARSNLAKRQCGEREKVQERADPAQLSSRETYREDL
ncbi:hypothetical protein AJ79_05529 [Helicocarpus griseus UAMH5409]|uniref:Uncharacterized protein n=1 Tax=Helicocarpus griseus UAMH5409 TaxID=1447875 RepID=A0A2B7XEU1_9EURO|nr:hypothetical protein AJ79_05529 [Helicocarpus griseus UAMH5409]